MYKDIKKLKEITSSIAVFNQKLNNIHFNYVGEDFFSLHKLTEETYEKFLEFYDEYSEKIRQLDDIAPGSFEEHLSLSFIKEIKGNKFTSLKDVINYITEDLSILIEETNKISEHPTIDPLNDELFLTCDKYRWLFKSFK